ncbi:MAG: tRNA threonylcarbamoyladenosine dehydratase [Deltaproteobacteria bacterium]|nr:tRNA threonylcarbamoyladenosine dehydratase [Deltaproteobacteria bacterium]
MTRVDTHGDERSGRLGIIDADLPAETPFRLQRRFDRLARLYGQPAVERLLAARVVVFGLGGVGGFAAEALARSAIGHLMLVDFDEVCITNSNRQLQALASTVGKSKAALLCERLRQVNPQAKIEAQAAFFEPETSEALLAAPWPGPSPHYDFVVDCIDNLRSKAHLLVCCQRQGIPVVSAMGAAGKTDPTRIRIKDLGETDICRLAQQLRKSLRQKHGLPKGRGALGITAVYSDEERRWPRRLPYDGDAGFRCLCPNKHPKHNCEQRALIDGTAGFVTGAFGLACAAHVVNTLVGDLPGQAPPAPKPAKRVRRPAP